MLTAEAQIDTERPGRYLAQLCRHAAAMGGARGHRLRAHAAPARSRAAMCKCMPSGRKLTVPSASTPGARARSLLARTGWCCASRPPTRRTCAGSRMC